MKTRRYLFIAMSIVLLLGLSLPLANAEPAPGPKPASEWPNSLVITSPPPAASISVYGAGIAKIIETHVGISTAPRSTSGVLEAAMTMIKGDAQLAAVTSAEVAYALDERAPYPKGSSNKMRGLFFGEYLALIHLVVRADSDIHDISDLKGKRCMFNKPGIPIIQDPWKAILEAYGMSKNDIVLMPQLGPGGGAKTLKERRADCHLQPSAAPNPAYMAMQTTTPIRLLSISDSAVKQIVGKLPWLVSDTIPAGTYKDQGEDVTVLRAGGGIVARKDLPDDLVYEIVKRVHEHIGELQAVHKAFKKWTFKDLVNNAFGPYHAGAYKYYMEKGLLTPESIATHEFWLKKIGQKS